MYDNPMDDFAANQAVLKESSEKTSDSNNEDKHEETSER